MKSLNKLDAFPRLTGLGISSLDLQNKDLKQLIKQYPKLKELRIGGNYNLTTDGYKYINALKSLTSLNISQSNFGDESLKEIYALKLKALDVNNSKVTGSGLALIAKFKTLETLEIVGLNLTDKDVECLVNLKKLKTLNIAYNKISNKSLIEFAKIKSLKSIILKGGSTADSDKRGNNSQITMKGLRKFVKDLPKCRLID